MSTATPAPESLELLAQGAVSVPDARAEFGISRSRLYELIAAGEVRSIKLGKRRLVPRAELARYLAERLEDGGAQ